MPDNRQPQTQSAMYARAGGISLPEPVEDVGKEVGFNPDTCVGHSNLSVGWRLEQLDDDAAPCRREFDGVRQQIPEDLLNAIGIPGNRRIQRFEIYINLDPFGVTGRANDVDCGLDDRRQIDGLDVEAQLAADDSTEIQQVVDQASLQVHVPANHREVIPHRAGQCLVGFHFGDGDEHGGQRSTELVAKQSQEAVLGGARGLGGDARLVLRQVVDPESVGA